MGFALDLASIEGLDKDEALRRLGYVDTGRKTDRIGRDVAWATSSKGRVVLIARYGWLKPERLADLSAGTSLVAGRFETHVGDSNAWGDRDGDCVWSVLYPAEGSGLTVEGAPPPEFAVIRDRLLADAGPKPTTATSLTRTCSICPRPWSPPSEAGLRKAKAARICSSSSRPLTEPPNRVPKASSVDCSRSSAVPGKRRLRET